MPPTPHNSSSRAALRQASVAALFLFYHCAYVQNIPLFGTRASGVALRRALFDEITHRLELSSHTAYLARRPADIGQQSEPDHHIRHHQICHALHREVLPWLLRALQLGTET